MIPNDLCALHMSDKIALITVLHCHLKSIISSDQPRPQSHLRLQQFSNLIQIYLHMENEHRSNFIRLWNVRFGAKCSPKHTSIYVQSA